MKHDALNVKNPALRGAATIPSPGDFLKLLERRDNMDVRDARSSGRSPHRPRSMSLFRGLRGVCSGEGPPSSVPWSGPRASALRSGSSDHSRVRLRRLIVVSPSGAGS